jgi:hypothetical protein
MTQGHSSCCTIGEQESIVMPRRNAVSLKKATSRSNLFSINAILLTQHHALVHRTTGSMGIHRTRSNREHGGGHKKGSELVFLHLEHVQPINDHHGLDHVAPQVKMAVSSPSASD